MKTILDCIWVLFMPGETQFYHHLSVLRGVPQKRDDAVVACSDCRDTPDNTLKFVLLGPHDAAYGI